MNIGDSIFASETTLYSPGNSVGQISAYLPSLHTYMLYKCLSAKFIWYPPQVKNSLISFIYSLLLSWSPLIVQITKKWIWRRNENVVCDVIEKTTIKSTARKKIVNLLTRKYSAKHFYFKIHNHEKIFVQSQSVPPNTFNKRTLSCA